MVRFVFVIASSVILVFYFDVLMNRYASKPEKYDKKTCYELAQKVVCKVSQRGKITNHVYGRENLPMDGGYIMYANHQGRYDTLAIIEGHEKPCSVLIDYDRSKVFFLNQFISLIQGLRLKRNDFHQQVQIMNELVRRVQDGEKIIIFPEGAYSDNHNHIQEFRPGCFKVAKRAKCPIVPVLLKDTYLPFGVNSLKPVSTYAYYLDPIPYEIFQNMNTQDICSMVKDRMQKKMNELLEEDKTRNPKT